MNVSANCKVRKNDKYNALVSEMNLYKEFFSML